MKIGARKNAVLTSEAFNETLKKSSIKDFVSGSDSKHKVINRPKYGGHNLDKAVTQRMREHGRNTRVNQSEQVGVTPYSELSNEPNKQHTSIHDGYTQFQQQKFSETKVGMRTGQFDENQPFQSKPVAGMYQGPPPTQSHGTMMGNYQKVNKRNRNMPKGKRPKLVIKNGKLLIGKSRTTA